MHKIHHTETSRDCLFDEVTQNLETIYALWLGGQKTLRFAIPVLCAVKLEAFINVAGKLHVQDWDSKERNLTFQAKCKAICTILQLEFDAETEPNKSALEAFAVRNSLVHPKMHVEEIDELISYEEYNRRSDTTLGFEHPLRSELTEERIMMLRNGCNNFTKHWGSSLLHGQPDYWLSRNSTGGFCLAPTDAG